MAKNTIPPTELGAAIERELGIYHQGINEAIDTASNKAVKDLAKKTRATAPVGNRGSFKRSISSKLLKKHLNGSTYVWYVKAPDHRLTHLLAHGHATKDGGRTRPDPFLKNALNEVLPDYQQRVEEALKNGN